MSEIYAMDQIAADTEQSVRELLEVAKLEAGDILVVGCSTSEVQKQLIGSASNEAIGRCIFKSLQNVLKPRGIYLAAQCCEHLNRALVLEAAAAKQYGYPRVNAVPQLKAGGSFATAAFAGMEKPYVVETIQAAAGIDIGDTLIGMHLRPVAVPVRISFDHIGAAHLVLARTRAKSIGGARAVYDPDLG
jgi:uncharacterized protein (TIGR01440 family)